MLNRVYFGFLLLQVSLNLVSQEIDKVSIYQGRKAQFLPQIIIDLSYQNLTEVPLFSASSEVEVLILDNNMIEKLPNWIANLKNLKILSVRNNNLLSLNSTIAFCSNLEQVYLSGNKNFGNLPNLTGCSKLQIIDVTMTKIDNIPGWILTNDNIYYFKYSEKTWK